MELESESDLAKELYNKVIFPIQTKNENAQKEYDVNNKKLQEELISQQEAATKAEEERIAQEAAIKKESERMTEEADEQMTIYESDRLPPPPDSNSENPSNMPPSPHIKQTCDANKRDIDPSKDCIPERNKPTPKAYIMFHPDKNPSCPDVANKKYQELTNKCEEYTSSPNKPNASDTLSQSVPSETPSQPYVSETKNPDPLALTEPEPPIQPKFDVNPLIQLLTTTFNKKLTPPANKSEFDTKQLLNVLSNALSNKNIENRTVSRGMPPSPDISLTNIITSCDGEPCDDPEKLQQPSTREKDSVSPSIEGDVPLADEPGSSWVKSLTSMLSMPSKPSTPSMPSVDISGKMNWITQSLVALFATVGNLFTFKPAEDNDPYKIPSTKESEGYIYIGKMYMKEEDENSPSKQVKYINYNPEKKDFYIDERPEVVEQIN